MTAALITLVAVVIVLALLLVFVLRLTHKKEREWALERQLLISRIQHPEVVHRTTDVFAAAGAEEAEEIEPEVDQSELVGKVMPGGD